MKVPPLKSLNLLDDIRFFMFHRPAVPTLIKFANRSEKLAYNHSIMQRIGIDVNKYSVLNIHRIGVEAPVRYVYEELLRWDGNSTCWPNHIASVFRLDGELEHIQIYFLGRRNYPLGIERLPFGLDFIPLFSLNALRFQHLPGISDDNARYLLYKSSGGYPIGIFTMYVRTAIPERGERAQAQLFMAVGFNFYGKEHNPNLSIVNKIWEAVHNRVTSNVLSRFKQLSEWRFQRLCNGRCTSMTECSLPECPRDDRDSE
jgi:hypothetical protein